MIQISVVMVVYNGAYHIKECINSVLSQTYRNFEFIIVDDGSTDDTVKIIRTFNDKRIRFFKRQHDYISSLNFGIKQAKGKYIARIDADDLMVPSRLSIQSAIMEYEPRIDICGSWLQTFHSESRNSKIVPSEIGHIENPLERLLVRNFMNHPTVMWRRNFMESNHIEYKKGYNYAEDYKLWIDAARHNALFFIEAQPLLMYRLSEQQVSRTHHDEQAQTTRKIKWEIVDILQEMRNCCPEVVDVSKSLKSLQQTKDIDPSLLSALLLEILK